MQEKSPNFSMDQMMRLANSPAGKQLMALLKQQSPESLNAAADHARAGDMAMAKASLQALLSSGQVQELMDQLRGTMDE